MDQDLLGFTHLMSGINLAEYVINYIDQHMILYGILGKMDHSILTSKENETTVIYSMYNLSNDEVENITNLKSYYRSNPILNIYNTNYCIDIPEQNDNEFIIKIKAA